MLPADVVVVVVIVAVAAAAAAATACWPPFRAHTHTLRIHPPSVGVSKRAILIDRGDTYLHGYAAAGKEKGRNVRGRERVRGERVGVERWRSDGGEGSLHKTIM